MLVRHSGDDLQGTIAPVAGGGRDSHGPRCALCVRASARLTSTSFGALASENFLLISFFKAFRLTSRPSLTARPIADTISAMALQRRSVGLRSTAASRLILQHCTSAQLQLTARGPQPRAWALGRRTARCWTLPGQHRAPPSSRPAPAQRRRNALTNAYATGAARSAWAPVQGTNPWKSTAAGKFGKVHMPKYRTFTSTSVWVFSPRKASPTEQEQARPLACRRNADAEGPSPRIAAHGRILLVSDVARLLSIGGSNE